ncbi:MAG: dihydrofolate reductase family protein [Ktedonobacterales bacterium]
MRKVMLFMLVTLDGFFEGPNQDISWHNVDDEFNEFAVKQLGEVDTLFFGRVTYQGMASYWPTPMATEDDPVVTGIMNSKPKVVFSTTLEAADWENSRLVKEDVAAAVAQLKQEAGKDIAIFGSSDLTVSLIEMGLVDELRILVNPVVLGAGKRLLAGIHDAPKLQLLETRAFRNGNVLLRYQIVSA